ncbi:unnamed protein product [Schistocephalus solidus]|uniref:Fucosyltransferase n=1 Tax=Schistocephalus solidus TaxID=70667 RepID=A0A183T5Q1_SCHSO|nr:unnamed protein product [Schistocephalus solidus]
MLHPLTRFFFLHKMIQISFFITHHTFAAVSAYYGVYRAFKSPNCVMSAEEREALKRQNSLHLLPAHHSQRSKMVAWVVSDMKAFNRRKELADAISKYVLVDTYGKHGMKCQKRWECFKVLSKQYKFYLSFENNNCEGYITEKFFVNALGYGMVPIVYGASREEFYNRAPPNSYIHVDDFENVEELTKYLQYLDKNDTAYATYFAWKEHGEILVGLSMRLKHFLILYSGPEWTAASVECYIIHYRERFLFQEIPTGTITTRTLEDTGTLPFIFYDKRLIYHDVFTEGCEYRCRYSSDIKDLQRAHLAVFTQNPPRVAHRYFKRTIWALETGEPIHLMPWIEQQNKAKVDKFGRHHKPCPEEFACFNWLSKQYKFYLSFENCNCDGYITEKFFVNALRAEMVPIVYGASREEYFARAPPNSFIHVDDFRTVKELTDYLYYLDKNDTAYASYFAWKEHGEILVSTRSLHSKTLCLPIQKA